MLSGYRLKEARAHRAAGERQELEAKVAPAKAELAKTLQRSDKFLKLDFTQPLAQIAQFVQDGVAAVDFATPYPTTSKPQTVASAEEAWAEFVYEILPRRGFSLSDAGAQRLLYFVVAQAKGRGADMSSIETFRLAFEKLYSLDAFDIASAEVGYDESQRVIEPVVEAPAPEPTVADIEAMNLTLNRKDEQTARRIVSKDATTGNFVVSDEGAKMFHGFKAHVSKTFGHDLTEGEQREIISWFQKNNRSFLDHRAYDLAKVNLVRLGLLSDGLLTDDERLSMSMEEEDTQTWQGRRNLKLELAAARLRN